MQNAVSVLPSKADIHGSVSRALRAKNTAVACLRLKPLATPFAVIEKLASVGWHPLSRWMAALRTGDCRGFDHITYKSGPSRRGRAGDRNSVGIMGQAAFVNTM